MMRLRNIFGWLTSSDWRSAAISSLRNADEMREILERERMRSDRCGTSYSLLTLTLITEGVEECVPQLPQIASMIHERLRATDEAGMLGPWRIGIALPGTPAMGAWKLADDICASLPADQPRPTCNVYVYRGDRTAAEGENDDLDRELSEAPTANNGERDVQSMEALFIQPLPAWKRVLDVAVSATALVLAAPLLLVVAAAIKLTSPGPVIFTQQRDTLGGRIFRMYKFRTMTADAEERKDALRAIGEKDGPAFKMVNDPRITPLGKFLRKTSIDELPQLFNVLKGDMTLVGPRAMPCDESNRCQRWQRRRLNVTAGLTCIWQVNGRSKVGFTERMRMDVRYLDQCSLANDLKLIAQTVPAVMRGSGAY